MIRKLSLSGLALAAALAAAPGAFAADEHNVSSGLTAAGAPLAFHGVDPVALLETGARLEGAAAHTHVHDGVAYYFADEDNMKRFKADPARYAPENGGFCTFGVSVGKKFDGDPQWAEAVDGKLYVFLNEEIFRMYQAGRAGVIAKAAKNWKKIRDVAAIDL